MATPYKYTYLHIYIKDIFSYDYDKDDDEPRQGSRLYISPEDLCCVCQLDSQVPNPRSNQRGISVDYRIEMTAYNFKHKIAIILNKKNNNLYMHIIIINYYIDFVNEMPCQQIFWQVVPRDWYSKCLFDQRKLLDHCRRIDRLLVLTSKHFQKINFPYSG